MAPLELSIISKMGNEGRRRSSAVRGRPLTALVGPLVALCLADLIAGLDSSPKTVYEYYLFKLQHIRLKAPVTAERKPREPATWMLGQNFPNLDEAQS